MPRIQITPIIYPIKYVESCNNAGNTINFQGIPPNIPPHTSPNNFATIDERVSIVFISPNSILNITVNPMPGYKRATVNFSSSYVKTGGIVIIQKLAIIINIIKTFMIDADFSNNLYLFSLLFILDNILSVVI